MDDLLEKRFSEVEDDCASGSEDWTQSTEKKRNRRRTSQRLCKRARVEISDLTSDESGDDESTHRNPRNSLSTNQGSASGNSNKKLFSFCGVEAPYGFQTGSFLILKKDAQSGYTVQKPCIWKIDGKALLQKFEPFVENDVVKHQSTSIYTGWSVMVKDLYAPVRVRVEPHTAHRMVVEMNFDQLKQINMDSD